MAATTLWISSLPAIIRTVALCKTPKKPFRVTQVTRSRPSNRICNHHCVLPINSRRCTSPALDRRTHGQAPTQVPTPQSASIFHACWSSNSRRWPGSQMLREAGDGARHPFTADRLRGSPSGPHVQRQVTGEHLFPPALCWPVMHIMLPARCTLGRQQSQHCEMLSGPLSADVQFRLRKPRPMRLRRSNRCVPSTKRRYSTRPNSQPTASPARFPLSGQRQRRSTERTGGAGSAGRSSHRTEIGLHLQCRQLHEGHGE
jgi:hypothetical protein